MATTLKAINKKKPLAAKKIGYTFTVNSDWDSECTLNKDNRPIFRAEVSGMRCCAFNEINQLEFPNLKALEHEKPLQEAFNKMLLAIADSESKGSMQVVILNRPLGKECKQPAWFEKCLENFPGSYTLPWMPNKTHDPVNSEVKMYMLPTP